MRDIVQFVVPPSVLLDLMPIPTGGADCTVNAYGFSTYCATARMFRRKTWMRLLLVSAT
jgi:hypothetical protein